jgi:hypothetical protein
MCPLCITTAALSVAGATSFVGVIAAVARKWCGNMFNPPSVEDLRVRFDVTADARRYNYLTTNETGLQLPLDGVRRGSYFRVSPPAATR